MDDLLRNAVGYAGMQSKEIFNNTEAALQAIAQTWSLKHIGTVVLHATQGPAFKVRAVYPRLKEPPETREQTETVASEEC